MYGTATLKLKPYFYTQSTLELDAKAFDIQQITMDNQPLKYKYDSKILNIDLGREFTRKDTFGVVIKYTAEPNELVVKRSLAITADRG